MKRRPHSTPANFGMAAGQTEMDTQAMATTAPNVHQQTHFNTQASVHNRQLTPSGTHMQSVSASSSENYQTSSFNSQHSLSWNNFSLLNAPTASSYSSHGSTPLTAYSGESKSDSTSYSLQNSTASTAYSLPYSPTSTSYRIHNLPPSTTLSLQNSPTATALNFQNSSPSTSFSLQYSTPHAANSLHNSLTAAQSRNSSAPTIAVSLQNVASPMAMSLKDSSPQTVLSLQNSTTTAVGLQNSSTSTPNCVYQSTSTILTCSITQSTSSTSPSLAKTSVSSSALKELLVSSSPKSKQAPHLLVEESKEEDSSELSKTLLSSEYDLIEEYISQDLQRGISDSKINGQDANQNKANNELFEELSLNLRTVVDLEYSSYSHSIKSITRDEISRIYDECPFLPKIENSSIELVETSKYIDALVLLRAEHDRLRSSLARLGDMTFVDAVLMMKEIIGRHHQLFPIISRRHDSFSSSDRPAPSPMTEHVSSLKSYYGAGDVPSSSELEASMDSRDQGLAQTKISLNPQASDEDASVPHRREDYSNKCKTIASDDWAKAETQTSRNSDQAKDSHSKVTTELDNNKTSSADKQYNAESSSELNSNTKTSKELNYNNQTSTELNYSTEKARELNFNKEISTELLYSNEPSRELQYNNIPPAATLDHYSGSPQKVIYNNNLSTEQHYSSGFQQSPQSQQRQSYSQVETPTLGSNPPRLRLQNSPKGSVKIENCQSFSCAKNAQDLRLRLPSVGNRQNTHQGGPSFNPKRFCTMNEAPRFPSHQMPTYRYMSIPPENVYDLSSETHHQNSYSLNYDAQMPLSNTSLSTPLTSAIHDTFYEDSPRQFSQRRSQDYEFMNTSERLPSQYYEEDKPRNQFHNQ